MRQARQPDAADFDAFYRSTYSPVLRQVYLLTGDLPRAEQVVADAYGRAWLSWSEVRDLEFPESWVRANAWRLTRNRSGRLMTALTERLRPGVPPDPAATASDAPAVDADEPDDIGDTEDTRDTDKAEDEPPPHPALAAALAALPDRQRLAVVLHHLADLPVDAIVAETRSSTTAVRRHLAHAHSTLAGPLGTDARTLSATLHRDTESVPESPPTPSSVRRSGLLRRRTRRTRTAVVAAVLAGVVAATQLLTDEPAPPPTAEPVSEVAAPVVTIPLSRFLEPADLPAEAPFASWAVALEPTDVFGPAPCGLATIGQPDGSRVLQFSSSVSTVRGYQFVRSYPTFRRAREAAAAMSERITSCPSDPGLGETESAGTMSDGGGFQVVRRTDSPQRVDLTAHTRAGRLVSLVWLTSDSLEPVGEDVGFDLISRTTRRLNGTPDPEPTAPSPVPDPLAGALLRADDVAALRGSSGLSEGDQQTADFPLTVCALDRRGLADVARTVLFVSGDGQRAAGQLLTFGANPERARAAFAQRRRQVGGCLREGRGRLTPIADPVTPGPATARLGDRAFAWGYRPLTRQRAAQPVYVVTIHLGRALTEVVLHNDGTVDDQAGKARALALAEVAVERLRAAFPPNAEDTPLRDRSQATATFPESFRFAEESSSVWRVQTGESLLSRTTRRTSGWALNPCGYILPATGRDRTGMVTIRRAEREFTEAVQLALHRSAKAGVQRFAAFETDLAQCSETTVDGGTTRALWSVQPVTLPGADRALLAVARREVDGVATPGDVHAMLVQVDEAVFLRVSTGQRFPRPGQPDEISDLVVTSARDNLPGICRLVGRSCDS